MVDTGFHLTRWKTKPVRVWLMYVLAMLAAVRGIRYMIIIMIIIMIYFRLPYSVLRAPSSVLGTVGVLHAAVVLILKPGI